MASLATPAPETGSDITILPDDDVEVTEDSTVADQARDLRNLKWILPILPWSWFLLRGLFASMDLVAVALPIITMIAGLLAVLGLVLRRTSMWLVLLGSLGIFFFVSVLMPFRSTNGPPPTDSIRVATVNTGLYWFSDNDIGFLVFDEELDLVVGVELAESHDAELQSRFDFSVADIIPLDQQQQNQAELQPEGESYRKNGLPSLGVYSNLPMIELDDPIADEVDGGLPGFRLQVTTDSGDIVVYALHIPRPIDRDGPYEVSAGEHLLMAEAISRAIGEETLPVVVLGDLNAVDRGQAYQSLTTDLEDGMRHAGAAGPTTDRAIPESLLFARVDHLLMSPGLCTANADRLETNFSDHHPIVADIGPCSGT